MRVLEKPEGLDVAPHSMEAERAVLGALILEPEAVDLVANYLRPRHFYSGAHATTFQALLDMSKAGTPIDAGTLLMELQRTNRLEGVGGPSFVTQLTTVVGSSANVEWFARQVLDHAQVRAAMQGLSEARKHLLESADQAHEKLERVERIVFEATQYDAAKRSPSMGEILAEVFDTFQSCKATGGTPGLSTGFPSLDWKTHGLKPGEVTILAGRPGSGKSTLAVNVLKHVAQQGKACAFISLEMPAADVVRNLACSMGRIDMADLRSGRLNLGEEQRFVDWLGAIEQLPLSIEAPSSLTIIGVRAMARRWKAAKKLDVLFLDYLQLLETTDHKRPRHEQVSEMSRGLKSLAVELNVPIVALAQLNRGVEERQGGRPRPSDLRESGSLEQDAAVVLLIHREDTNMSTEEAEAKGVKNKATLIVGKNRYGPTGDIELFYDRSTAFFGEVVK